MTNSYFFNFFSASFEICLRSFSCDLLNRGLNLVEDPITVVFSFMVKGTPPKVEDLWVLN